MNNLTILVPAYNEATALKEFLPELLAWCGTKKCCLIIVNDGSTDDSKNLFDQLLPAENVTLMTHKM